MQRILFYCLLSCFWCNHAMAQLCTNPGQTPETAVLICTADAISANTPTFCGSLTVPVSCNDGFTYINANPNFFRMNCFASGTLGFTIHPDDPAADYNWQLFDITNYNPNDVFTVGSLFVACNWSPEPGVTGATAQGGLLMVCGNSGGATFSKMPQVLQGHAYMLMVSNQSLSPDGYQLSFSGGTASITDPVAPHLQSARTSCDGGQIVLRTNKRILCTSLAPDGSDFLLNNGTQIISAFPGNCNTVFGTDSVILNLSQPLPNGTYILQIKNGSDGNTLKDYCDQLIPVAETVTFTVSALQPTPLDSVAIKSCSPSFIDLVFQKNIRCNSIATDGSDFIINGPQAVTATVVPGICSTGVFTPVIRLQLAAPITAVGVYTIQLQTGNDGNTIIDECGLSTPAGASRSFSVNGAVSAAFTYSFPNPCDQGKVLFSPAVQSGISNWSWNFGNGVSSNAPQPIHSFSIPGQQQIRLAVSNGTCSDTVTRSITTGERMVAAFDVAGTACPGEMVSIANKSNGNINRWQWNLGNGSTSSAPAPPRIYFPYTGTEVIYTVSLIVFNTLLNCSDTISKKIKIPSRCAIGVPTAFTPNNDGRNDFLYPLHAMKTTAYTFQVYNRNGQLVFFSRDPSAKWDGKINGLPQDTGVYIWMLDYTEDGSSFSQKGTTLLLR